MHKQIKQYNIKSKILFKLYFYYFYLCVHNVCPSYECRNLWRPGEDDHWIPWSCLTQVLCWDISQPHQTKHWRQWLQTHPLSSQGKPLLSHMSVLWWLNEFVCIFLKCLTIQDLSQEPTGFPLNWFLFSMPVQQLKKTMVPFSMTRVSQKGYRAQCRGNPTAFLFPSVHHILEAGFC